MGEITPKGVTRRDLFKIGGVAAAGIAGASALSACSPGNGGSSSSGGSGSSGGSESTGTTTVAGHGREGLPSFLQAPDPITDITETKEYDVVVIGAGAAGVPAALAAREEGASVALLQKESIAISQGNTGSGIDLEKSDPADVENLISVLIEEGQHRTDRDILNIWRDYGAIANTWVIERALESGAQVFDQGSEQQMPTINKHGYNMEFVTSYFGPKPYTTGDGMQALAQTAEKDGVEIFYSTPAEQLVKEGDAVVGVIASTDSGYVQFNASKGVIVATGDYQNDEEMCDYYQPDMHNFVRKQNNKTGDGHKMIIWAGGAMEPINHTHMLHDFDAGPASMCDMPFLAVKNSTGARFTNEEFEMSLLNNYLRSEEDQGYYSQIFDSNYMEQAADWPGRLYPPEELAVYMPEEDVERQAVFPDLIRTYKADTLEELAEKLEIADVPAFIETVNRYNDLVAAGADTEFGKNPKFLIPVQEPPFYGISRWLRISALLSGVEIDANHQCLTPEGTTIPGLYAIGNCSGRFYGGVDYPMTIPGTSLGRCYAEGYYVGRLVAGL